MLLPMQEHLRSVLKDTCDSAMLELQKFPELPSEGKLPPELRSEDEKNLKKKVVLTFCKKIEKGKNFLPDKTALPEPQDGMGDSFDLVCGGRLLVNHTGGLIENTNLCLHHLFGYPMIPGSALKGIARSYANEYAEDREQFARIFGGEEKGKSDQKGNVAFMPAVPVGKNWKIIVDVLTPHYGCDTKNPIPLFFPAVERGTAFHFLVRKVSSATSDDDLKSAIRFLIGGLTTNGIGAKTAAGYGWFKNLPGAGKSSSDTSAECGKKIVDSWGFSDLQEHIEECFDLSANTQKYFVQKMIKEKVRLIRTWRKKENPKLAKLEELAKTCGEVLPE